MEPVLNRKPGRKPLVTPPELIAKVKAAYANEPNVPVAVLAQRLKMGPKRFYKILKMESQP